MSGNARARSLSFSILASDFDPDLKFRAGHLSDGAYNDDWRSVALTYVKGVFWFDVATSVPISFIEHATLAACRKLADSESNVMLSFADGRSAPAADGPELRLLRVLKPIRLIKIMRVFKLGRSCVLVCSGNSGFWDIACSLHVVTP